MALVAGTGAALLISGAALAGGVTLLYTGIEMPETMIAKWVIRPLAVTGIVAGGTGGLPTGVGTTTTTETPGDNTIKPMKLGINLAGPTYFNPPRPFWNLALTGRWVVSKSAAGDPKESYFNEDGDIIKANKGDIINRPLGRPGPAFLNKSVDIICRWDGNATIGLQRNGSVGNVVASANSLRFTYLNANNNAILNMSAADADNPAHNLDCRETGAPRDEFLQPDYISYAQRFNTLRFMEWPKTNDNTAVTWATRSLPIGKDFRRGGDNYPIEYMVDVANAADSNMWVNLPWNADEEYYRKYAELVRDRLNNNLSVYVELSNEVWNWAFPVTSQARNEGVAENLSPNAGKAMLYRYAEKSAEVMDIWKDVFKGQEDRLVRVLANQAVNPWNMKTMLEWRDTPDHFDALASAPYFGGKASETVNAEDLSEFFDALMASVDKRFDEDIPSYKALAELYGKRFVTYEAGQHVTAASADYVDLLAKIERDPRMGAAYTKYLRRWQQETGDMMVLFNDMTGISKFGAFGLLEHPGQKPGGSAKSQAVVLFQASIAKK